MDTITQPAAAAPATSESLAYGAVHLDVVDVERSLAFWRDLIGLRLLEQAADASVLGAGEDALIVLRGGAERGFQRGHTGLFHVAIHLPDAGEFARVLGRLMAARIPQSPTDHVFSKATYVRDPDSIMLELTLETPERYSSIEVTPVSVVVRDSAGRARGGSEPLDIEEALAPLGGRALDGPLPAGSKVGHVHLHVADLAAGYRYYRDVIGFSEHALMPSLGMADLGAGGAFPHRLALNDWHGPAATPPPPATAGMRRFELVVPDDVALAAVRTRLDAHALAHEDDASGALLTRDPAGNTLRLGVCPLAPA